MTTGKKRQQNESDFNSMANRILSSFEKISMCFRHTHDMPVELTHNQLLVASCLKFKKTTMTELSQSINMSTSALTGIVDKLIDKKIVERDRDTEDRRVVCCMLSDKGKKIINDVHSHIREKIVKMLENMSLKDRATFMNIIEKVSAAVEKK